MTPLSLPNRSADRRADLLDRRHAGRGGRRLTDRRADVVHGLPCDACDTGILTLVDAQFEEADLRLLYHCPVCGDAHVVTADPQQIIAPEVYERALAAHHTDQKADNARSRS